MSLALETNAGIARLTIEGADGLNVLDFATMSALRDELGTLAADPAIRVVILTGAGTRAFSAGADITYMRSADAAAGAAWGRLGHQVCRMLETMDAVTIAALNGLAVGGGCELALSCDLRYGSAQARLGQPEVNVGLCPGWGGTQRLARVTGLGFAKDLVLTGRLVDADEALRRGLINGVGDPVLELALQTARSLVLKSAVALATAKELCNRSLQGDHDANLSGEADRFADVLGGAEAKEGLAAFLEKREPRFGGAP